MQLRALLQQHGRHIAKVTIVHKTPEQEEIPVSIGSNILRTVILLQLQDGRTAARGEGWYLPHVLAENILKEHFRSVCVENVVRYDRGPHRGEPFVFTFATSTFRA